MRPVVGILGLVLLLALYLLLWPVPVDPVAWQAPPNPGYQGPYERNAQLASLEQWPLKDLHGPEDIALDASGRVYAATGEGVIVRISPESGQTERWADTGGRPLGIEFDRHGNLIVADAYRGLLSVAPNAEVSVLTNTVNGEVIRYADDVDVAVDGSIYFSDASSKFGALDFGGTFEASLLDILEHGGHGRLLRYDPVTQETEVIAEGINFANGVAVSPDQQSILVNETGHYRVLRVFINSERMGELEVVLENLPGFPDNLSLGLDGRFWLGLISPRSALLDALSDKPFLREVVQRLPAFIRPSAQAYGHVIAFNEAGNVVANLQDPDTSYSHMTGVTETPEHLYISSLKAPAVARLRKDQLNIAR